MPAGIVLVSRTAATPTPRATGQRKRRPVLLARVTAWTVLSMQRVIVMGGPGSGKSIMARHLGARFGLPVFHLDQVFWRRGWVQAPLDVFLAENQRLAALPFWVIDGNFSFAIVPRLRAADTVVYLDMPTWLCLTRVIGRWLRHRGEVRADMSKDCPEKLDLAFLWFVWRWNRKHRAGCLALVRGFAGERIILRGRSAVRGFSGG